MIIFLLNIQDTRYKKLYLTSVEHELSNCVTIIHTIMVGFLNQGG